MHHKGSIFCFAIITGFLGIIGCRSRPPVYPTNYSSFLSNTQVTNLTTTASAGDGDAAFKLYRFYDEIKQDRVSALKWLEKAADSGVVVAQYNMGMDYDGELYPDIVDLKRAKYWFQRAADAGNADAKRKLLELKSQ
jgi:TPR repeat protein